MLPAREICQRTGQNSSGALQTKVSTNLNRKWKEFHGSRLARLGQYSAGTIGLTVGLYFTFSHAALAAMFSAAVSSGSLERRKLSAGYAGVIPRILATSLDRA